MDIFTQLSLILVIAAIIAGITKFFKQPAIIAYILTGLVVGPYALKLGEVGGSETFSAFAQFGVSILLFIVGIHLSPKSIKDLGKTALFAGGTQVILTTLFFFLILRILGFNYTASYIAALALSFSSTIIVLKLLSDAGDLQKLHGKLSIGILLFQDVIASLSLIFITTFYGQSSVSTQIVITFAKGLGTFAVLWFISARFIGRLTKFFANSQEHFFLFALAWGFGISSLFKYLGFSQEVGALIAGICLSFSPYSEEASFKLRPLRDFFVILFFVYLGAGISFNNLELVIPLVFVLSICVLVFKPLIVTIILELLGFNKKVSIKSGLTLGQISEFSLIFILLAQKYNYVSPILASAVTSVGIVTIAASTYLIMDSSKIFNLMLPMLRFFERVKVNHEELFLGNYDIILFGCNRVGWDFVKTFSKFGTGFLAVDFNPEVVGDLKRKGINCRFGDAEDAEFLKEIDVAHAKMVVSTIPDFETNLFILTQVRKGGNGTSVVLISYNLDEALALYDKGATYVILPHFIGGQHAAKLANQKDFDASVLVKEREKHITYLKERKEMGHAHPQHTK